MAERRLMKKSERVVLKKVQLKIHSRLSAELARTLDARFVETFSDSIAAAFSAHIYGHHEFACWIDRAKDWLNRRFGYELEVRRVTNVCPHLNGDVRLHLAFAGTEEKL